MLTRIKFSFYFESVRFYDKDINGNLNQILHTSIFLFYFYFCFAAILYENFFNFKTILYDFRHLERERGGI